MAAFDPIAFTKNAWKNAPWIVIAVAVHAVALAAMAIWAIGELREVEDIPPVSVNVRQTPPREDQPPPPPPEIKNRQEIPENVEAEIVEHERNVFENEIFVERDWTKEIGDPNADDEDPARSST